MSGEDISFLDASSGAEDGEMDWEEVDISPAEPVSVNLAPGPVISSKTIEITLPSEKSKGKEKAGPPRVKVMSQAERVARLNSHKIHTVALLASTAIRNRWANDKLLHARLMSLTPLALQHGFSMIHKKLQPDASKRGRLFEAAMSRLCEWWYESFDVYPDVGIKSRTYDQVAAGALDGEKGEVVRSEKSLMKHALQRSGSRDISAQLFTALCRSLGIPARLVFSVQSVPWQASVGKPKPKPKKSTPSTPVLGDDSDMEEVPIPGPSKPKAQPAVKLRKRKPPGRKLQEDIRPPLAGWPPVFWTEVFSRPDGRWIPVDPVRNLVNKKRLFEPPKNDPNNRMSYVVAFEEDGYVRDVTRRYARASTKLLRGGRAHKDWWENVLVPLTRPYRLNRDDVEDDELQYQTVIEGMPTSVAAFKDHPLYVLERHLRRDEVIHPRTEIGRFRGDPVFSRSAVISLKTAENWMRQGRTLVEGAQPLKRVPMRAVTINRRREVEAAAADGEETLQGLYSYGQTEVYVPPPIVDGRVPKNDFGNLDLYVPSMLPAGAVHIPHKGTAKIARQLGFDFAEAVTGFEFKKRRATPIVTGVVVAAENEEALLEAYWASVADSEEKERAKRRERVLKRWTRLVHGLRIRERLQKEYATTSNGVTADVEVQDEHHAGGFVTELDNVVQHFTLPKPQHVVVENAMQPTAASQLKADADAGDDFVLTTTRDGDEDVDMEEVVPQVSRSTLAPKTMQQLAEERPIEPERPAAAKLQPSTRSAPAAPPQPVASTSRPRRAAAAVARAASTTAARGKKRTRRHSVSSNSATSSVDSEAGSDAEFVPPTPARTVAGRTLRARAPKSAEKVRAEKELERAYRRAVAD